MNNWERMKAGRLYNADSKDLEQYHKFGMETCDKFNRTPLWRKKRKQRLLEKLIPSAKDGGAAIFAPFYCEYGVNIHFGKGCFVNYKCAKSATALNNEYNSEQHNICHIMNMAGVLADT